MPDKNSEMLMDRQTEGSDFSGPSEKSATLFEREKRIVN